MADVSDTVGEGVIGASSTSTTSSANAKSTEKISASMLLNILILQSNVSQDS